MGNAYRYQCPSCGKQDKISFGGGMMAEAFHCDSCGKEKMVSLERIMEANSRFTNALIAEHPDSYIDPLLDDWRKNGVFGKDAEMLEAYLDGIAAAIGRCFCGGRWSPIGTPSCPSYGAMIPEEAYSQDERICWD